MSNLWDGWEIVARFSISRSRRNCGRSSLRPAPATRRQLTATGRPVRWAAVDPAHERFVFALDQAGSENYQLFLHNISTGESRRFASGPWENRNAVWSEGGEMLAFNSNARNGRDHDLYLIRPPDAATGRSFAKSTVGACHGAGHRTAPESSRRTGDPAPATFPLS